MDSILVTGIGGGVGQSVIKALQQTEYNVVGVDSEELATGLYGVKTAYKGLYAKDSQFIDRLTEICIREKCSVIFPGHDVELPPLSKNFESLKSQGIIPMVSSPEIINISDDKLETVNFLISNGFNAPKTVPFKQLQDIEFPVVLKPQHGGARSKNTFIARNIEEFDIYKKLIVPDNCVVQEYIEGKEYTCGTVSFEGHCYGTIVMRRILRNGDTYKAFVENNPAIESQVHKLVEILKPFGACNVQLRVKDGKIYVFEINARCSGTTAARALAGFNEPKMVVDYLLHGYKPQYSIREITILRYWKELVVENQQIEQLKNSGFSKGNKTQL